MGTSSFERDLLAELPMLRRFAQGMCGRPDLAEDLAQETAMRAWANQDKFDGTNMAAWLITICRNLYRSMWRNVIRRETPLTDIVVDSTIDDAPQADRIYDANVSLRRVLKTANGHTDLMIEVALGATYGEIKSRMAVPEGTVKSRIGRMRVVARQALDRPAPVPLPKPKIKRRRPYNWTVSKAERIARLQAGKAKAKAERLRIGLFDAFEAQRCGR